MLRGRITGTGKVRSREHGSHRDRVVEVAEDWKKVGKHAHGLETLTADQRHKLRKELKKLRYAVEFFSSLFPAKRVDPFLKRLKKLQTVCPGRRAARIIGPRLP